MVPLDKVLGTEKISDLKTKHLTSAAICGYMTRMCPAYAEGRSNIAQELHSMHRSEQSDNNILQEHGKRCQLLLLDDLANTP